MRVKHVNKIYLFLICVILIQALRITWIFATQKESEHSDEIWSYGLANSYYQPYIFMDDNRNYVNIGEWIDSRVLRDYITVQKNERFAYDSVISNMKKDLHPPLYFMVLHTICSFAPDTYSRWYGFVIGIVCFLITQLFLFKLSSLLFKDNIKALCVVIIYGFVTGGVNTGLFVRHYSMALMFMCMTVYYLIYIICKVDDVEWKTYCKCLICSALSMMTLYVAAIVLFVATILVGIYLFCLKRYKHLIKFLVLMALSTVPMLLLSNFLEVALGLGKSVASDVASAETVKETASRMVDYRVTTNAILYDFFGIKIRTGLKFLIIDIFKILLPIWIIAIVLLIILQIKKKIFTSWIKKVFGGLKKRITKNKERAFGIFTIICLVLVNFFVVIYSVDQVEMILYSDRYLFLVYPLITILVFCILYVFSEIISKWISKINRKITKTRVVCLISVVFVLAHVLFVKPLYLFERVDNSVKIEELCSGKRVAALLSGEWLLTCYTDVLFNSSEVFVAGISRRDKSGFSKIMKTDIVPDFLIIDVSSFEIMVQNESNLFEIGKNDSAIKGIENCYWEEMKLCFAEYSPKLIQTDSIFGRNIFIYSLSQ